MAASSSIGSSGQGLYAIVLGAIEDEVSLDTCEDPVSLNPCGHLLSQETAEELLAAGQPCATCRAPITSYARSDQVSRIAQAVLAYQASEEPAYSPEAWQLCKKGKKLLSRGLHAPALELFLSAQEIDPFSLAVQTYLELAVQFASIEKESRSTEETTESYLGVLCKLADHPEISQDPVLGLIIEQQIEEMIHVQSPTLTVAMRESADLFRRLVSEDNRMSISVSKRIKERYAPRDNKRAAAAASSGAGVTSSKATAGPANRQPSPTSYTKTSRKYREPKGSSSRAVAAASSSAQVCTSARPASEVRSTVLYEVMEGGLIHWVSRDRSSLNQFDYRKGPEERFCLLMPSWHFVPRATACYHGDLVALEEAFGAGSEVNRQEALEGASLLHWAAAGGHVHIIDYLIRRGARVDAMTDQDLAWGRNLSSDTSESDQTPLFCSIIRGHVRAVLQLIRSGANPRIRNHMGNSPILYTSFLQADSREVYRALWESRADRNIQKNFGKLPEQCAFMVSWEEDRSSDNELRLDEGEEISINLMLELVGLGANEEGGGQEENTPLHYAACCEKFGPEMIRARLEIRREELNAQNRNGETSLHRAIAGGLIENVRSLLYFGADHSAPDREGRTPLHYAVRSGDIEILRELIQAGANVHALDAEGNAPIHYAARSFGNKQEMLIELGRAGSKINAPNRAGKTPLALAFRNSRNLVEVIKLGADVGGVDEEGNTLVHQLARCHELREFAEVLDIPSQMNIQNSHGDTPLHLGVQNRYTNNAAFLLALGAACLPNHLGQTPL